MDEILIDLGLPSGTLWAKTNLGAEKESDFGLFYTWGDTQGYDGDTGHGFSWNDYKLGRWDNITKYNNSDDKTILDNADDPVYAATDSKMKTPTKDQLQELIDSTDHQWVRLANGVNGMKFINKNDDTKYIFIPAAGDCTSSSHDGVGSWGCVWTASRSESNMNYAWCLYFDADCVGMDLTFRCDGYSVCGVLNMESK